ncbi:MAG: NAD-dependent epimerase/dehydratase family protein [Stagnimonas sp.]|nr:NAD-dependent epimerase/dehydratase family protein [Stagnimonas sp.]
MSGAGGRLVAVTGATGFLGRQVVAELARRGWRLRLLVRSQPLHPLWQQLEPELVLGSLADRRALDRLVAGADAVLHLAGLIKARDRAEFLQVNRDGSRALAEAVREHAPAAQLLLVSSLAAREPGLSDYGASKRAGEEVAFEVLGHARVSVIRPPAIYGPGDRETLVFFQLARGRLIPLLGGPRARMALIHVEDAAAALADRLEAGPSGRVQAIADGRPQGYGWRQILAAGAEAVGNRRPRYFQVPAAALKTGGWLAGSLAKLAGQAAMLGPGKVRELLHEDWGLSADELWRAPGTGPAHGLQDGFASTADWYRQAGWL